jgi:RNA 2',3'-cyclic 3'-phosphodiesterase
MRLFLALPLKEEVRAALAAGVEELHRGPASCPAPCPAKVGWVAPGAMHLTLKFLGETDEAKADVLLSALRPVCAALAPPAFAVTGAGTFPPRGRPRVVWAGVEPADGALTALAAAVEEASAGLGWERETRPFRPHLTLGRVRGELFLDDLLRRVETLASRRFGAQSSPALVLFRSHLSPAGARHEQLASFPFGGGARG